MKSFMACIAISLAATPAFAESPALFFFKNIAYSWESIKTIKGKNLETGQIENFPSETISYSVENNVVTISGEVCDEDWSCGFIADELIISDDGIRSTVTNNDLTVSHLSDHSLTYTTPWPIEEGVVLRVAITLHEGQLITRTELLDTDKDIIFKDGATYNKSQ